MKLIPLTSSKHPKTFTMVDDEDFAFLNQWKWKVATTGCKKYAAKSNSFGGKDWCTYIHRVLLFATQGVEVDHINGDSLDNRKRNLRLCTRSQNVANTTKMRGPRSSKYRGVSWNKKGKMFLAQLYVGGKHVFRGLFEDEIDAAMAYNAVALQYHGKFAKPNIIDGYSEVIVPLDTVTTPGLSTANNALSARGME